MMEAEQVARPRNAAAGYLAGLSSDQHHCPRLHLTWSPPLVPPPPLPPPRLRRLVCFCCRWLLRSFSRNRFRIIQSTLLSGDGSKLALSLIT